MHEDIVNAVEAAIREYRAAEQDSPTVQLVPGGIRQEADWYYVVVESPDRPARAFVYYDHLREIERILAKRGHKVLLVPTLVGV